jgi:hypothetical protein
MEEGLLPIEQLKEGDMVLSKNERTGELGYCRVAQPSTTSTWKDGTISS